ACRTPRLSRSAVDTAVIASGMSWAFSLRRSAVTTTSSSAASARTPFGHAPRRAAPLASNQESALRRERVLRSVREGIAVSPLRRVVMNRQAPARPRVLGRPLHRLSILCYRDPISLYDETERASTRASGCATVAA